MVKKLQDLRKNKKGFTLVELIVVLVILAILIALLIPALTGYIDKAREKTVAVEARNALMAAQTIESEEYGTNASYAAKKNDTQATTNGQKIVALGELPSGATFTYSTEGNGKVTAMTYVSGTYTATYDGASWTFKTEKK